MTNEERARRWIEDRDLGRATMESDVMSLAIQFDKVREAALRTFEFCGLRGTCPRCAAEDPDRYVDARPHSEACVFAALPVVASPSSPLRPREG